MSADPRAQRRRDTEHRLTHNMDVWVATASADRQGLGHIRDVSMIDGEVEVRLVLGAGQIEPGGADGDREGGPAQQMETL